MALASCSRTRDAIGDSADAGLETGLATDEKSVVPEYEKLGVDDAENGPVLLDEEAPERCVF